MAHLVNYEEALAKVEREPTRENYIEAARCAIAVSNRKNSQRLAWQFANEAIEWAKEAGVQNADDLVRDGRCPDFTDLLAALE